MANWSHLKKYKLTKDSRAVYPVASAEVNGYIPELDVATAIPESSSNEGYRNASLAEFNRMRKKKASDTTGADLDKDLAKQRKLFARHVIKGWRMKDADGNDVEFNEENCLDFLKSLDDEIFRDLMAFCRTANNFYEEDDEDDDFVQDNLPSKDDAEDLVKNSQKDTSSKSDTTT